MTKFSQISRYDNCADIKQLSYRVQPLDGLLMGMMRKRKLLADEVAVDGEAAEQQHEEEAQEKGQHAAHQAIHDPVGAAQP